MRSLLDAPLFHLLNWLQVYKLSVGFRFENVCQAIGNYVEQSIELDGKNFDGTLRDYVRLGFI